MKFNDTQYDVIIIGGSSSGLAAGMALGRALKKVLIIDSGKPANAQTPYSHNFLTQDGNTPKGISTIAKQQVAAYPNVKFLNGRAVKGKKLENGFEIITDSGKTFLALKLIFATGIKDIMPSIKGFSECWGISAIHCPYCHGYELRNTKTGILGNGDYAFELSKIITNWAPDLTIYTNGKSTLTSEQQTKLNRHNISIVETEIEELQHINGQIHHILFKDGAKSSLTALYSPRPFVQHSYIPEELGCELTDDGYIKVNALQETTVDGIYAAGDNSAKMRTIANAVATGTVAGMSASKKLMLEQF